MSAGGSIAAMISSMKNSNRRKNKIKPFSKYKKTYTKSDPIQSKKFTQLEKDLLSEKLKEKNSVERRQMVYKVILSVALTVIMIAGIMFLIRFTFF